MKLHNTIIRAIKKIANKTIRSNKEGVGRTPLIMSENDLCCYLFKELYGPARYQVTTEWTSKKKIGRHDLVIFDKKEGEYKLNKAGGPKEIKIKKYLAIIELKVNHFCPKKPTVKGIKTDTNILSKVKNAKDKYVVCFDFVGNLSKQEIRDLKVKGVHLIYENLKIPRPLSKKWN